MIHGISDEQWLAYLDHELDASARDLLEAHILGCASCWEFNDRMARSTMQLAAQGRIARHSVPLTDEHLHSSLSATLARIRGQEQVRGPWQTAEVKARILSLERVMAPMCGAKTAVKALRAAAQGSPAQSLDHVSQDNWTPFLASLRSIATVMCGETGAHLVWEWGME